MQRPRCSAKLPNRWGCTSPITRSGSSLMRAGAVCAPSAAGSEAAMTVRVGPISQRYRVVVIMDSPPRFESLPAEDSAAFANDDELPGLDVADPLRDAVRPPD